jgi:hypothetical protein
VAGKDIKQQSTGNLTATRRRSLPITSQMKEARIPNWIRNARVVRKQDGQNIVSQKNRMILKRSTSLRKEARIPSWI